MSSLVAKIRRFQIIIQALEKGSKSKRDLIERCADQGFEVSERTFERDIEELRRDFNVELEYDPKLRGYKLEENTRDSARLKQVFELSQEVQALQASFFSEASQRDRIQFEPYAGSGTENMDLLMKAIQHEKVIRFKHFNYHTEQYTHYEVYPLLLKEYARRWYLYAWVEDKQDCRTFGLDRIEKPELERQGFNRKLYTRHAEQFQNVIGLNYTDDDPERVILKCTRVQAWYLDSAPWHSSMRRAESKVRSAENDEAVYFQMDVIPNYELKQKILSMVDQIEVVEPLALRQEMMELLHRMKNSYTTISS